MAERLSVLVVDDTVTYRKIVSDAVNALDIASVTATAPTGEIALMKLAQAQFDLALVDIEMPGMGGLETLVCIKRDFPDVDVVIVSGVTERAAYVTIKAMNSGAFEFIRKPAEADPASNAAQLHDELGEVIQAVWRHRCEQPDNVQTRKPTGTVRNVRTPDRFGILAIGVSTGGPVALTQLIPALPSDFPLPIVLVQHMPAIFTRALADDLNRKSSLEIREAEEGHPVRQGQVLIAPGGRHMVVRATTDGLVAGLNDGPKENSCRPAVDVLFRSVATSCGASNVLAVIMTGMGSDGMRGVQTLKRKGCRCLTQSKQTCVVYGMPQAVDAAGLSDESVDLDNIADRLVALAAKGAHERADTVHRG